MTRPGGTFLQNSWFLFLKMTDRQEPKLSAVAMMENWKAAVTKETAVAAVFDENWGYLKARPEEKKVNGKPLIRSVFVAK